MNKNISLLIVENKYLIAYNFKRELERLGYRVFALASSGKVAIEVARQRKPDVVLIDMGLDEGASGLDAAREIASRYKIPIIFVIGQMDHTTLEKMKAIHPAACLAKPIMGRQIHVAISRHFRAV